MPGVTSRQRVFQGFVVTASQAEKTTSPWNLCPGGTQGDMSDRLMLVNPWKISWDSPACQRVTLGPLGLTFGFPVKDLLHVSERFPGSYAQGVASNQSFRVMGRDPDSSKGGPRGPLGMGPWGGSPSRSWTLGRLLGPTAFFFHWAVGQESTRNEIVFHRPMPRGFPSGFPLACQSISTFGGLTWLAGSGSPGDPGILRFPLATNHWVLPPACTRF